MIESQPISIIEPLPHSIDPGTAQELDKHLTQTLRPEVEAARTSTAQRDEEDYGVFLGINPVVVLSDPNPRA